MLSDSSFLQDIRHLKKVAKTRPTNAFQIKKKVAWEPNNFGLLEITIDHQKPVLSPDLSSFPSYMFVPHSAPCTMSLPLAPITASMPSNILCLKLNCFCAFDDAIKLQASANQMSPAATPPLPQQPLIRLVRQPVQLPLYLTLRALQDSWSVPQNENIVLMLWFTSLSVMGNSHFPLLKA